MDRTELPVKVRDWIEELWAGEPGPIEWLRARGLNNEYIEKYLFGYVSEGHFGGSISIPILDGLGVYRTSRFRRLEGTPKYDHPKGERAHLFNISSVRHPKVYLTEGEFDATILEQTGRAAVGVPGVNSFREEWRWLFVGNDVRIIFDSEEPDTEAFKAVRSAVGRIVRQLEPLTSRLEVIDLPVGEDVSSLYVRDPAGLEEILRQYDD
jgi:hypothetical protein